MLHCMNVALDGTTVATFQQAVHELLIDSIARNYMWNPSILIRLKGHLFGPANTDMFALHGEQRERHDLVLLLNMSNRMQVSKGQDRLYALMPLARDYEEGRITVDYNKTEEQVMADAAAYHISQHRDLKFLTASFRDNETDHPTWIPEGWMGRYPDGTRIFFREDSVLIYTNCSRNCVDIANLRLRIRGVSLGWARQLLLFNLSITTTLTEFWTCPLGEYIELYLGDTSTGLLIEFSRAIHGGMFKSSHEHESIQTGLSYLWELRTAAEQADRAIGYGGDRILDLLAPLKNINQPAWSALREVLRTLFKRSCITTNSGKIGLIPKCNIREGDEIWLVLGCPLPVVMRPQPNGRYRHICPAYIPALMEHEDIAHFVSEIQPGDRVGEWTVEDIELE
jgi:hypothetical protein